MTDFISTRNSKNRTSCTQAIIRGLCDDGGLFLPENIRKVNISDLRYLNYQDLAFEIIANIFDTIDKSLLKSVISDAYGENFSSIEITPVHKVNDRYFLDLYEGPTCAFKDIALQFLPRIMAALKEDEKDIVILTATSGDTGKAALEGFRNLKGTRIKVLYPYKMVSVIQEKQMTTTDGDNTEVIAVKGNFDDCQRMVKEILENETFESIHLSSANSINIARLVPQCVYYFKAYFDLWNHNETEENEPVDFIVPTGNFGDILAGYLAKMMGLPINRLVIASNENNVLTDFFKTGVYDARRVLHNTISPSIDILVSSNLERLLYLLMQDSDKVAKLMNRLKTDGVYRIDDETLKKMQNDFLAFDASEQQCLDAIRMYYENNHYLIDPHTAVAVVASQSYKSEYRQIILSTASPFKFAKDVYYAISNKEIADDLDAMETLAAYTSLPIPHNLSLLHLLPVMHTETIEKDDKKSVIDRLRSIK